MPIQTAVPVRVFDQESYHRVDRRVTGIAFDIYNEFGRYLDERLYQAELTRRCREVGFEVEPELRIIVSLGDFSKLYLADHLIGGGVLVEDKAVAALDPAHRAQALNYLFLCGLHHATLINFRTPRIQHEFDSTRLTPAGRRRFETAVPHYKPLTSRCRELSNLMRQLLTEWGAYLELPLYRAALTHFLGGEERVIREVRVASAGTLVGSQKMHLLTDDIAFSITGLTYRADAAHEHQRRFLRPTPLRALQWINLNHDRIEMQTIER